MTLNWKRATPGDLEALTVSRVMVLRAANQLDDHADLSAVEAASRQYYARALDDDTHAAWLVYSGDKLVGTGGVSFFQVMPTVHNPTGRKAYIMNMYTAPEYRRQGIARRTLEMIVAECRRRGVMHISLEATSAGRPLYAAFGFVNMKDEMILPEGHP